MKKTNVYVIFCMLLLICYLFVADLIKYFQLSSLIYDHQGKVEQIKESGNVFIVLFLYFIYQIIFNYNKRLRGSDWLTNPIMDNQFEKWERILISIVVFTSSIGYFLALYVIAKNQDTKWTVVNMACGAFLIGYISASIGSSFAGFMYDSTEKASEKYPNFIHSYYSTG